MGGPDILPGRLAVRFKTAPARKPMPSNHIGTYYDRPGGREYVALNAAYEKGPDKTRTKLVAAAIFALLGLLLISTRIVTLALAGQYAGPVPLGQIVP